MDELVVGTDVEAPPAETFAFLSDLRNYGAHADYLASVSADGDGTVGTQYDLQFVWWRVEYAASAVVTELDPPTRIGFELETGLEADGEWRIEPSPETDDACRIRFVVRYDPDTVGGDALTIPTLVPVSTVIDRAEPVLRREAERILAGVVAELEGERRPVEVSMHTRSDQSETD